MDISDSARRKDTTTSIANPDDLAKTPSNDDPASSAGNRTPDDVAPKAPSPAPSDQVMDSLTQFLDTTLKIQEIATKTSRLVAVPQGFRLTLAAGPSEFYKVKEELKRNLKRKRDAGIVSKASKQYPRHGYRPEEVLWNGALDLKNCRPSNLTTEIHPLLQHSRFDDTPDAIYNELETGLRLATMFLTQPICCQFWVTLACGERKTEEEYTMCHGTKCERIEKNVPMTKENTAQVIEYIKQLDNASMIHWNFKHNLMINNETMYGVTQWVCDNQYELTKGPINTVVRHHIRLHADFYTVAAKLSKLEHPDTAQKLRFSFFLATVICHELAHAIEGAHHRGRHKGQDRYLEPWLFDDEVAEMGRAWESITFGGTIHPINAAVDCSHGIGTWDWPDVDEDGSRETSLKSTISMKYIEKLFQMKTWQQSFDLTKWKTFHIPRDGAVSLNVNSFTTMPWSEEARVAKEELEESLIVADPEQPAAKKREIATGEGINTSPKCRGDMPPAKELKTEVGEAQHSIQAVIEGLVTTTPLSKKQQKHEEREKNRKKQRRKPAKTKSSIVPTGMLIPGTKNPRVKIRNRPKKSAENTENEKKGAGEEKIIASDEPNLALPTATEAPSVPDKQTSASVEQQSPSDQSLNTSPAPSPPAEKSTTAAVSEGAEATGEPAPYLAPIQAQRSEKE